MIRDISTFETERFNIRCGRYDYRGAIGNFNVQHPVNPIPFQRCEATVTLCP